MNKSYTMSKKRGHQLVLALPSKGELHEQTLDFLKACGMPVQLGGNHREYSGRLRGVPQIEIIFLRADEIPMRVERGGAHLGITGEDLFREYSEDSQVSHLLVKELGYGHARLVTAVPRSWIDTNRVEDLEEVALAYRQRYGHSLRVATKYPRLTRAFFAEHGIVDYVIVRSLGATEGAPASGVADIIVDITSTGTTLAQNHLKPLSGGTLLASQACLISSIDGEWSEANLAALQQVLELMEGHLQALYTFALRFHGRPSTVGRLENELRNTFNCEILTSRALLRSAESPGRNEADTPCEIALHCPADNLYPVMRCIRNAGCSGITATRVDYIFGQSSSAFERFCHLRRHLDHSESV
jgi:ATP phosphoribosyltransferase